MRFLYSVLLSSLLFASLAGAQSPAPGSVGSTYTPHMTFDVASIHESRGETMGYFNDQPNTSYFHAQFTSPLGLILAAYNLESRDLLENVPEWAKTTNYDVTAKSDPSVDEILAKLSDKEGGAEKDHMLQELLADRFKLRIHSEVRASTIYELSTTSRTAKLIMPFHGDIAQTFSTCKPVSSKAGMEIDSKGCPASILLGYLRSALGSTIVDHTGLSGLYTFHIAWGWSAVPESENTFPNILFSIREQLGLEVTKTKGTKTIWIVDHIERPTQN